MWRQAETQGNVGWHGEVMAVRKGAVPHSLWWIKSGRDILGGIHSSPMPDCTAQGSRAGKINPHKF